MVLCIIQMLYLFLIKNLMGFFLYQILVFMAPGLYKNEKWIIFSRTILGALLFFLGLAFCIFIVLPNVFNFFQSVGPELIDINTDISKFLNFLDL